MGKHLSSMFILIILLLPAALTVISTIDVAAAAGNVTINDFTCEITKGKVPFTTRLYSNVTGEVTTWRWRFYNPQIDHPSSSGADRTTSHTFGAAGAYGVFNVTLEVWGPGGYDSLKKIDYVVGNKNTTGLPVAAFSASTTYGDAPLTVTFNENSKNATSTLWYFGLKDTSKEENPTFTFNSPGTYRVVLEVSNPRGWDATAQEIIVHGKEGEKIFPVANFESYNTSGLTVQFIDLSENAKSWYWDFGDGTASGDQSPIHTYSTAGDYNVNLIVGNDNGTASHPVTISVQAESSSSDESDNGGSTGDDSSGNSIGSTTIDSDSSSNDDGNSGGSSHSSGGSSSGGSGGGGAGLSPEPQSNVEAKELSQTFIGSGSSVKFDFPQDVTPVMNISFNSKKTAGKTTAIVEMLINQSTLVSVPPSDEIFKYINIWVGNNGFASPENIENAVVYFKVDKSWVQDKNIDKSSIILNRYNDTKTWNVLPSNLSGEDDKYLYFRAETPGFSSPFAITGKVTANETVNATPSETQTGPNIGSLENNANNTAHVEQTTEQKQSPSAKTPGFEAVCGIIGLLGVFLYIRRQVE